MTYTVVIPLYNKASHVRRAIDSVLAQSLRDFELLVVDDGSTDGGGEIVGRVEDPRVRLISQANTGVSVARNRGVQESVSDLVAFLDADDSWEPHFLETVASLKELFPQAAVWGTAYRIVRRTGITEQPPYHGALPTLDDGGLLDFFGGMQGYSPLAASGVLVQKEALRQVGGFPVGVFRGEDTDTFFRLALRYPIAWSPRPSVVVYEDAENRTDTFLYLGNFPLLESARAFQAERGLQALGEGVVEYLAWRHTGLLRSKWLTGERSLLREIVRDFRHTRGYSRRCLIWFLLSWVPHPMVEFAWKTKQRLAGRDASFPESREIRSSQL